MFYSCSLPLFVALVFFCQTLLAQQYPPQVVESDANVEYTNKSSGIPAGTLCGSYGTVSSPALISKTPYNTYSNSLSPWAQCRDSCMDSVECISFSVNTLVGQCQRYSKTPQSMGFKAGSSSGNLRFYQRACYSFYGVSTVKVTLTSDTITYDDDYFPISLPFQIKHRGFSAANIYMHVNGFISFITPPAGSNVNGPLPSSRLPSRAICAFWQDNLVQVEGSRFNGARIQSLSYEYSLQGVRYVRFNWKVAYPYNNPSVFLDAYILMFEDERGPSYIYWPDLGDDLGSSARIGSQMDGQYNEYFGAVIPGNSIRWDSTALRWTA